jgi:hypothetical protein
MKQGRVSCLRPTPLVWRLRCFFQKNFSFFGIFSQGRLANRPYNGLREGMPKLVGYSRDTTPGATPAGRRSPRTLVKFDSTLRAGGFAPARKRKGD